MKKRNHLTSVILTLILVLPIAVWANHISIDGNVTITDQVAAEDYTHLKFDISWENSWRTSSAPNNWDAAWVFAKFNIVGDAPDLGWKHCTLSSTDGDHSVTTDNGVGVTIDAVTVGKGIFIHRSSNTSGNNNWDGTKLRWNYGTDLVADDAVVDVKVFAIEMVYIPEGSFSLFSGESADLYANFNSINTIDSEDETEVELGTITWSMESSWCGAQDAAGSIGGSADLLAAYPKGYKAIYCMKYEISQGQYVDFLNTLTSTQNATRYMTETGYRHGAWGGSQGSRTTNTPDRACNYLSWADGLAYADWSGLRPMTELEYEKICRGSGQAAGTEYAWGDATIHGSAYTIYNDGTATAIVDNSTTAGNCSYNTTDGSIDGPLRCGIFADAYSDRQESGASYYGVMEMSGNLWERCITIAKYCWNNSTWNNTGAGSFDGQHGDGVLTGTGFADVSNWPSPEPAAGSYTAYGSSFRGGNWGSSAALLRVSARYYAASPDADRYYYSGFRAVRTP